MKGGWLRRSWCALAGLLGLAMATAAPADVVVTIQGDTAYATISLTDGQGVTYDADVTIVFDHPEHLTARNLNLQAQIIDADFYNNPINGILSGGVTVDPAFPVLITVAPPDARISATSKATTGAPAGLSFDNTYQIDVHTHDLVYTDQSPYRLFKAPIGQPFDVTSDDVTNAVLKGSVRVRGRGGAFSQFLVVNDPRAAVVVALGETAALNVRVLASILSDGLRLELLQLLVKLDTLLLVDLTAALDVIDQVIDLIVSNEGTDIANVWSANGGPANDAGEMAQLAYTIQFSIGRGLLGQAPSKPAKPRGPTKP